MLVGQGVAVGTVLFNGQPATAINDQVGSFNGTASNIGLDSGLVLCTGRMVGIQGPNMYDGLTLSPSAPRDTPDPDLATYAGTQRCVAALEFDFIPSADSISFRFVFGSEEYPEYVCAQYNDAFGFFLSGPGLSGPFTNGAINLAVLPGTNVPVAINTVNPGVPGALGGNAATCAASDPNWQANAIYFIDNPEPDLLNPTTTVELDGFTVPLSAGAAVQCGQTYHIKMVIAHTGDNTLDSAVLIEGGSFSSESHISVTVETPMHDGILMEGCRPAQVTVQVPMGPVDADLQLSYSGSGITDGDILDPATSIIIPAGATSATYDLSAASDDLAEGVETLWIHATWTSPCGYSFSDSVSIALHDHASIEIITQDAYAHCDQDSIRLQAFVTGGLGDISMVWSNGTAGPETYVDGTMNATYSVTATDECPQSVTTTVKVDSGCGLSIPNVITPDQDGSNDAWVIGGLYRTRHRVTVFNRWGQVIFESTNYDNNWRADGIPDGTYFYEVITDRSETPAKGSLTILGNTR